MTNPITLSLTKKFFITNEDLQEILPALSVQDLCSELFKRDADFIVNSLVESKKQELLAALFKDQPATPALVEELKHQLKKCNALELDFSKETLLTYIRYLKDLAENNYEIDPDVYEKVKELLKNYQFDFRTFLEDTNVHDAIDALLSHFSLRDVLEAIANSV